MTKQKFKNRLNRFFIRIDHYISEYERTNFLSSYSEDDFDTDLEEMKTLIVNLSTLLFISSNFLNAKTFIIISFDSVKNAETMIINLVNRSLSHFLINNLYINTNDQTSNDLQTDLKIFISFNFVQTHLKMFYSVDLVHICIKNTNSFTYIIINRYTFEMFYDIMINSNVSIQSIVDYKQYLVFIKNIFIDLIALKHTSSTFNSKSNQSHQ
jgi:hypothetical protein